MTAPVERPRSLYHDKNRAYYEANRDVLLAKSKAWRAANPERLAAYRQQHRLTHADRIADSKLRRSKGIGLAGYGALLAAQDGVCAICGSPETARANNGRSRRFLSVDHDHEAGHVRGLICARCNTGLGAFGDDAARIDAAARYLRERSAEAAA